MVVTTLHSKVLDDLCSQERLNLMDSIDTLRSQGLNHFVSLPQIIVCGDQSSGKSSVLEAISGVSFPVKSDLCTRFPTELVLRRTQQTSASVSIVPHHARTAAEKTALASFHEVLESFDGLSKLIDNAKLAMGITTHGKAFARDLLRIEISGPDRPHLTIVDLPGLIHSETKNQSASDVGLIQEVVESYMKEPRSIILAVVSAKNDFANQVVLKRARSADPSGSRTLGVITKPDTLHAGSASESQYISLARNQEVEFRLGWHVLKNLDSEAGYEPLVTRDAREAEFFEGSVWKELPESALGIGPLRTRLSELLLNHITKELPSLIEEIETKRTSCRERLEKLGEPRATLQEQQLYLIGISESFQRNVQSGVDGDWNDIFFADAEDGQGPGRRIRAVVHNMNEDFAYRLAKRGHRRHIVNTEEEKESLILAESTFVTREEFVGYIEEKIRTSRGRELPGLFHPMIVADVFREQAGPWERLTTSHVHSTWEACQEFLKQAIAHVSDASTSPIILSKVVQPAMDSILVALDAKTKEILGPHQKIHPTTYNDDFKHSLHMFRKAKEEARVTAAMQRFLNVTTLPKLTSDTISPSKLIKALVNDDFDLDTQRLAASEALDHMNAYYEVVEVVLMAALPAILSPLKVFEMSPELVAQIAGETDEAQSQRQQLTKQLAMLTTKAAPAEGDDDDFEASVETGGQGSTSPSPASSEFAFLKELSNA